MTIDAVRAVADAVLYEGYLLYPYRAGAVKNRSRWQFGVLGPPAAAAQALGEPPDMAMQCLVAPGEGTGRVTVRLRFLQVQAREVQRLEPDGSYRPVDALTVAGATLLSWDEAVEREISRPDLPLTGPAEFPVDVPGGEEIEPIAGPGGGPAGRIVRRRWPLTARVRTTVEPDDGLLRLTVAVANEDPGTVTGKDSAIRRSLVGAHLLVEAQGVAFVSLLEPPLEAAAAAARCRQHRCWPVLAGPPGTRTVLLGAPIILYDHPEVAEQSPGQLFDSTEIDEILTLRVMTMTEAEKAEARATDPRAQAIVDRCDSMSAADLLRLHGGRREIREDVAVEPDDDAVVIAGVRVAKGSLVRVHPSRRADAQDLFFADQIARVAKVITDFDDNVHVAVVLVDDPAADLHDWYGRYFYFAPDELQPVAGPAPGEEYRS
ncbi:MAG: hypothetical protein SYR96_13390 [Actinomycetota bacterium]|nr:hypothetical protein [Actinomycetota bacterium]